MTSYTITLTGRELSEIIFALRLKAAERRSLVKTCGDIGSLAKQKASFQAEAEQLDALATKLNLSAEQIA